MNIKIIVATHKAYAMPQNELYLPVQVGAALNEPIAGYTPDNTGQHISAQNPFYNELTALYWAKYHLADQDVVGLAHYRRYLGQRASHDLRDILDAEQIAMLLSDHDVIVPKKRHYYIESQEQHYLNAHAALPYETMLAVVAEKYPQFATATTQMRTSKAAHLFNMSIMKQAQFQAYTDFVFDVLGEVAKRVDLDQYTGQDRRALGFLGERLMDVWLLGSHQNYVEVPLVQTERTNWLDKGYQFLKRHFGKNGGKTHF